jgi:site-specific recombinase XerD
MRQLLLLLYAAGLRSGEARRLRRSDVDLNSDVITVRDTKFFKSRLVPIGRDLSKSISRYMLVDQEVAADDAPLFPSRLGDELSEDMLDRAFRRVARIAGIRKSDGKLDVRMHDLRHTFAVHRLVEWYRKGMDVQVLVLRLSTYMGHIDLRSTQVYLTMTRELLSVASNRFEGYARPGGARV